MTIVAKNEFLTYVHTSLNFSLNVPLCETWYLNLFCFKFGKLNTCVFSTIILFLDDSCSENEILAFMDTKMINEMVELVPRCETWYVSLLGFVFSKREVLEWLCQENEILVYMPTILINEKFELVPWCKTWYVNLFGFVFCIMKVLEWLCRENEILVYMPTGLINGKFELVPWCETWYVNLFGFKFGKIKVLNWPLSSSLINV